MAEYPIEWGNWVIALAWALGLMSVGLWVFWRDEANYGRA